jgi:multidrug efflux pump subunit AcrA (membrane-fusion protein)
MKKLIVAIVVIAAATGGYAWYAKANGAASAAATQPIATATVARGNIFQAVAATGKVTSNLDVDIKCKASGEIITLPFDISQPVKKGDLLVELDPVDENRNVRQAEVALASSKAKLEQAKQNLIIAEQNLATAKLRADANLAAAKVKAKDTRTKADRRKELLEQNLTSHEDYDTAETAAEQADADVKTATAQVEELKAQEQGLEVKRQDVALAKAEVDTDQISLDTAKQRLFYTKVISPMDGVVSALNVQKGVIVASGTGGFSGGTTLMTVSDLSHIFVLASVDESDIGQVKLDSTCLVTADAFPGKRFRGKVVRIATKGVNTSNVVTFEVKIEITGENKSLLKPEMTTNCQIVSAQKDDVLIVPTQAVTRKDRRTTVATVVLPGGKQEERTVTTGLSDGDNYEITDGLAEGDTVVVHKDETNSKWNGGRPSFGMMGMGGSSGGSSRRGGGR